jgi:hypothetical protein
MRSADAARDFAQCVELQQKTARESARPHHLRSHVCLGDAYAKNRQMDKARAAWQAGLKVSPDSKELKDRLAIKDNTQLLKFIETQRSLRTPEAVEIRWSGVLSLEHPIDTDLSFMDRE